MYQTSINHWTLVIWVIILKATQFDASKMAVRVATSIEHAFGGPINYPGCHFTHELVVGVERDALPHFINCSHPKSRESIKFVDLK